MRRILDMAGVVFFQLVAILSVTFLVSLLTWSLTADPDTQSGYYMLFLGLSITLGVWLAGALAFKFHWLKGPFLPLPRLVGTVLGAYLPMLLVLLVEKTIPAGHPIFTVAIMAGILGFHLPTWLKSKSARPGPTS